MTNKTTFITITDDRVGQRLDNFLLREFKNVPKSRIYKALRKGEVRVNKGRIQAEYRLAEGDIIRLPPLHQVEATVTLPPKQNTLNLLSDRILYEDPALIVLNKPAGMAVHGGSGISHGVIETMRLLRPELKDLELVHRLDRDTSGCLLLAKKHSALRQLHAQMRDNQIRKTYQCLCKGRWRGDMQRVNAPLLKNQLSSGERIVRVNEEGKDSLTVFRVLERFETASLMQADIETGRTHQIRVHALSVKHPLAGDERYGDKEFNQHMKRLGLKRLFLHAIRLSFTSPANDKLLTIEAPLDATLIMVLDKLRTAS